MISLSDISKKYALKPYKYTRKKSVYIVDTDEGRFVLKKKIRDDLKKVHEYLDSRNFTFYPKLIESEEASGHSYYLTPHIEEMYTPREQKFLDLASYLQMLHVSTTHYKEVQTDDYKKIYEKVKNELNQVQSFYDDMISDIESKVYMSPYEYLIARNINKIFAALNYSNHAVEKWYELVKNELKQRVVYIHGNLELDHFIKHHDGMFISWDNSRFDLPVYDLVKLYKKHWYEFDFHEFLRIYEDKYPLREDEIILFKALIATPDLILEFNNEYDTCLDVSKSLDYIYKTERLIELISNHDTDNNDTDN